MYWNKGRWRYRWERKRKSRKLVIAGISTLGRLKLKTEFEASRGYMARPCLKKPNTNKNRKER